MAYGGFTAGLKAGHVSNTWPLMLGRWIPQGLFSQVQPALLNVVDAPVTVVFIHRWLAFAVLAAAVVIATQVQSGGSEAQVKMALVLVLVLGLTQITLGIATVISRVEIGLALLHQFNALCLFGTTVYVLHRLRAHDEAVAA
jgi:cytochrome c oxidase assembly protein subunit 15